MIKKIDGDLLSQPLDSFVHQANCFTTMGSGIAKSIKIKYVEVYEADCRTDTGDFSKMGTFSFAKTFDNKIGYNMYSQFRYGKDGSLYTNYSAMRNSLELIKQHVKSTIGPTASIGIPYKVGCSLGGGDWNVVYDLLKELFENDTLILTICELK